MHLTTTGCEEKSPGFDGQALNEKEQIWEKLDTLLSANAIYGDNQYWGQA